MAYLKRRSVLKTLAALSVLPAGIKTSYVYAADDNPRSNEQYLAQTRLINHADRRIVDLAAQVAGGAATHTEAAVKLHDWVRDMIPFGIAPAFYDMSATDVLDARIGYCNTKSTLLMALLRARGIPARLRVVDLSARVLDGLFDPGTPYVDHAITEVWLNDRWLAIDSMVIDGPLEQAARRKLQTANATAGWGIHAAGSNRWSGNSDCFIQAVHGNAAPDWIAKDHGHFADIGDFYDKVPITRNRKTLLYGALIRFGAPGINRRIDAFRRAA
jgi:Transglutaminase-like superfamily